MRAARGAAALLRGEITALPPPPRDDGALTRACDRAKARPRPGPRGPPWRTQTARDARDARAVCGGRRPCPRPRPPRAARSASTCGAASRSKSAEAKAQLADIEFPGAAPGGCRRPRRPAAPSSAWPLRQNHHRAGEEEGAAPILLFAPSLRPHDVLGRGDLAEVEAPAGPRGLFAPAAR